MSINRSKLYEWLLDNDCPFDWNVDEFFNGRGAVHVCFYDKEESNDY